MEVVQTWREAWFGVLGMKKHGIYDGFSLPSQRWWKLCNATLWFYDVFEYILARNRCFPSFPVRFCIYFLALRFLAGSVFRWLAFVFFGSSVGWRVGCLAGRSTAACSDVAAGLVWRARHEKSIDYTMVFRFRARGGGNWATRPGGFTTCLNTFWREIAVFHRSQ